MYNITKKQIDKCSTNARNTFLFPSNDQENDLDARRIFFSQEVDITQFQFRRRELIGRIEAKSATDR